MTFAAPTLCAGHAAVDAAFRLAAGTLAANTRHYRGGWRPDRGRVFIAGLDYVTPWTRDAAFNTWFAGALVDPEAARETLLAEMEGTADAPAIGAFQRWDRIIWAWGAWQLYLRAGGRDFLALALAATENTLRRRLAHAFDPADGLFRGGACFQDGVAGYPDAFVSRAKGSGIEAWLDDHPEARDGDGGGLPMKALSTNALHLLAFDAANAMRRELGRPASAEWTERADALRAAIPRAFWSDDRGAFGYLVDAHDPDPARQEGLGAAFALLADAVPPGREADAVARQHVTPHGLPCVWPAYDRYDRAVVVGRQPGARGTAGRPYARHAGTVWPHVNAAWAHALARRGFGAEAWREMRLLADKAVRDVGFYELYHPDTGLPYGGLQEEASAGGVIEWAPCRCQTWAATGFMDMAFTLLAGLRFAPDGLTFAPYLPDGADGGPRLEALTLTGLRYREAEIDLEVRRGGASGVWIDGRAAERVPAGAAGRLRVEVAVA